MKFIIVDIFTNIVHWIWPNRTKVNDTLDNAYRNTYKDIQVYILHWPQEAYNVVEWIHFGIGKLQLISRNLKDIL